MRNGYEQLFPLDRLGEEVTVAKSMGLHTVVKPLLIVGSYKNPKHTNWQTASVRNAERFCRISYRAAV